MSISVLMWASEKLAPAFLHEKIGGEILFIDSSSVGQNDTAIIDEGSSLIFDSGHLLRVKGLLIGKGKISLRPLLKDNRIPGPVIESLEGSVLKFSRLKSSGIDTIFSFNGKLLSIDSIYTGLSEAYYKIHDSVFSVRSNSLMISYPFAQKAKPRIFPGRISGPASVIAILSGAGALWFYKRSETNKSLLLSSRSKKEYDFYEGHYKTDISLAISFASVSFLSTGISFVTYYGGL